MNTSTNETQQDTQIRMVALTNLRAMCDRISGICHTFTVTKVSRSRVHVEYSNPSEYGTPNPVTAVFPCYPSPWPGDEQNPRVILDAIRYLNSPDEEWQAFCVLTDCAVLWRHSETGEWQTAEEIERAKQDGGNAHG